MNRRRVLFFSMKAMSIACTLVAAFAIIAQASPGPGSPGPWKSFSSSNGFLTGGTPFNGSVLVTSAPAGGTRSGADPAGYLARARKSNPQYGLGDFAPVFEMREYRHGSAAVIARGPMPTEGVELDFRFKSPPRDNVSYLYIVGGREQGAVSGTVERAEIDAEGSVYPGLVSPAGFLMTPRYGAAAVTRGDFIYVIGGYDGQDQPVGSIERFKIDSRGNLGHPEFQANPGWGGDTASVIVNGYLYVMGGNDSNRGPNETVVPWIKRTPIDPRGSLGPFEEISTVSMPSATLYMPIGVAGGRAVAVASWNSGEPIYSIYYIGGNLGQGAMGASRGVYRLKVANDNSIPDSWEAVPHGQGFVELVDPRELFAAVVTNGYLYVIGGETTTQGLTTYYSFVERAPVGSDGVLGQFVRLDGSNSTYINDYSRASDINAAALNNRIYVPGGRDASGFSMNQIFMLNLDQGGNSLLADPVDDVSLFGLVSDLGQETTIHSLAFDVGPNKANASGIRVRFRSAFEAGNWGSWTPYFSIAALPPEYTPKNQIPGEVPFLLDLSYSSGAPSCLDATLTPNPTNRTGPVTARFMEYEVMIPEGDASQKLHRLAVDPRPIARFALPGGYDPIKTGGPFPPSCAPTQAIADMGVTDGWVRFKGVDFNDWDFVINPNTIRFAAAGSPFSITVKEVEVSDAGRTLDVKVDIGSGAGGPFTYDLIYQGPGRDPVTLLSPAILVSPVPALEKSRNVPGLDVNPGNAMARENVLEAPAPQAIRANYPVALFGDNFRSGRVNDTGPQAVDDPDGFGTWPANPDPRAASQVSVLRYKVEDQTSTTGGFIPLKLWNMNLGEWKEVPRGEFRSPKDIIFNLEVNTKAKSGPHDLIVSVQNPQLGRTFTATQTVYVVPAFGVSNFKNYEDPTPDQNAGAGNRYDWTGSNNPAVSDLGDGLGESWLLLDVTGYGFQSDSYHSLIPTGGIASVMNNYAPSPRGHSVADSNNLQFRVGVPWNTIPRLHHFEFDWQYELGVSDPLGHVEPGWDGPAVITRTWNPQSGSWVGLYVVPPRVGIQSILGTHNTTDPIIVLQSDSTLTVNGVGFATQGPAVGGFASTLYDARLISMANSPVEDIHPMPGEMHMVSDCQARFAMYLTENQRAGQMYMLEIKTHLPDLELDPTVLTRSKVRTPYSIDQDSSLVTVLPLPVCNAVTPSCLRAEQGTRLSGMVVSGRNFDMGTSVDLGPGITIENMDVCHDDPARGCVAVDKLTFDAVVSPLAAPGPRLLQVDNGPTSGMSMVVACSDNLWVVPRPAVSSVHPSEIQQPPMAAGVRTVPVDIYGSNFVSGAEIQVTLANGTPTSNILVKPPVVVVDSGHITAELIVHRASSEGGYNLRVSESSGPACGTPSSMTADGSFQVTPFREIALAAVSSQGSLCQGQSGTLDVTGSNFNDPQGGVLISSASLGAGITVNSMTVNSSTSLTIAYSIHDGAGLGQKSLLLDPVSQGATPATWPNALLVTSSPSIQSVSPAAIPGGSSRLITISGRNFQPGATVSIPGLAVSDVTVDSIGQITARVTVSQSVGPEMRTITVNNNDGGQCNVATMMEAFRAIPEIAITSVNDDMTQCQGRSGTLTVTGMNFRAPLGSSLVNSASLGPDVSINSLVVDNATKMTLGYSITDNSTLGMRGLTVNSNVQGAAPAEWANALKITSSPSIMTVSPRTILSGTERQVSITGRNFYRNGAGVEVTPVAGVTVKEISVVNSSQILATIAIDENAQADSRTITVVNADGGQCAEATFNAAIQIVDPPHINSTRFLNDKKKLRISGTNFHPSMQLYIGGSSTPARKVNIVKNSTVVIKYRRRAFKRTFPVGLPVPIRLVNPDDGGETTITVIRRRK